MFWWAEHCKGTSHRRKRLQKAFPHILCGCAVLARGFSKSEALLALPRHHTTMGSLDAAAPRSHLSRWSLCSAPAASNRWEPNPWRSQRFRKSSAFLTCKCSCNHSSLCLAVEGKSRCCCQRGADLCCAGSSPRHFPLCWSKRLSCCGFPGFCLSYRLKNVLLATLALKQSHAAGSGWPWCFHSAKLSMQQLRMHACTCGYKKAAH